MGQKFGQHFLKSTKILEDIAEYAKITKNDIVLEIGAGYGNLTTKLTHAKKVYAVEIDKNLIPKLIENTAPFPNIELINGDALRMEIPKDVNKIIGNLPYEISGPITEKVLLFLNGQKNKGIKNTLAVLMYQREFAERMDAFPGLTNYSRLTVLTQYYSDVEIMRHVPRTEFRPAPKIESTIVRLTPRKVEPNRELLETARILFTHKNKKLSNALMDSRHELKINDKDKLKEFIEKELSEIKELLEKKVFMLEIEELEEISEKLGKILNMNRKKLSI